MFVNVHALVELQYTCIPIKPVVISTIAPLSSVLLLRCHQCYCSVVISVIAPVNVFSFFAVVAVGIERPTYRVTEGDLVFLVVRKSGPIAVPITFRVSGGGLVNDMATFDAGVDVFNVIVIPFNTTDNDIALEPDLVFNVTLEIITPDPRIIVAIRETTVTVGDDDGT